MQSRIFQDATVRNFEIVGESVKKLSDEMRSLQPELPWKQIAGLRDILIHNYANVDLNVLWRIAEHDLPAFRKGIESISAALDRASDK